MKHPEHICRFNDSPQSCECFDEGYEFGAEKLKEEIKKRKSDRELKIYANDSYRNGFLKALDEVLEIIKNI